MFKGDKLSIMLFGESHGACVGVCIEGLPHGIKLDWNKIDEFSRKRKGVAAFSTPRREADKVKILSGEFNGYTTGGPLCAIIENKDTRSKDYTPNIPRPSHADYTAKGRYGGYNDYRGGGMFSGRLTAALVFAGAVADSILESRHIYTASRVCSIHDVCDAPVDMAAVDKQLIDRLNDTDVPLLTDRLYPKIEQAVLSAKEKGDSVGGVIECLTIGCPPFIGGNYFSRLNAKIAGLVFSLPAFCGLEFGSGFDVTKKTGSQINDCLYMDGTLIKTKTNNSGGINGGITNGMPIVVRCAVKPTPSVHITQDTVDMDTGENVKSATKGRHDPCIALRATTVLKSVMEIALLDALLSCSQV